MAHINTINWHKFKGYNGKNDKGFEEMCYQIAKRSFNKTGRFTSIDDSGGGDGVEFYLTLPNGDEWGWQCKYYDDLRLDRGGRKASIINSLETATKKHINLKKWHLCLISNLTPDEQKWFDKTLNSKIPLTHTDLSIKLWGDSELLRFLGDARMVGIRNFFFGELELDQQWFSDLFQKQFEKVKDKFDNDLHVDTSLENRILTASLNSRFFQVNGELLKKLREEVNLVQIEHNNLIDYKDKTLHWNNLRDQLSSYIEVVIEQANKYCEIVNNYHDDLLNFRIDNFINCFDESLYTQFETLWNKKPYFDYLKLRSLNSQDEFGVENATRFIRKIYERVGNLLDHMHDVHKNLDHTRAQEFNILGDRGSGKTHLACHLVKKQIDAKKPAIFLPAIAFKSVDPLHTQLLNILDIRQSYTWDEFIDAADIAASVFRSKLIICIDALNESTYSDGIFNQVWKNDLIGVVRQIIQKSKHIIIVTTCRSTYKRAIWGDNEHSFHEIAGFNEVEAMEAQTRYFQAFNIVADFAELVNEHFKEPIFLKLYCEAKNPRRQIPIEVHLGEEDVYTIIEQYTMQLNQMLVQKLGKTPGTDILAAILNKIATQLFNKNDRSIPLAEFRSLVEGSESGKIEWDKSVSKSLIDEGLFFYKDLQGSSKEFVTFNYDLMAGYFIAVFLINSSEINDYLRYYDKLIKITKPLRKLRRTFFKLINYRTPLRFSRLTKKLFNNDFEKRHALFDDIIKAAVILLPKQKFHYLQDIVDNPEAHNYSFEGLFSLPSTFIRERDKQWVEHAFANLPSDRLEYLFSLFRRTWIVSSHPFNSSFFHTELSKLSMAKRDGSWTIYLLKEKEYIFSFIENFEKRCIGFDKNVSNSLSEARLANAAEVVASILVTNYRLMRDLATCALYWYGRVRPMKLHSLLKDFLTFDDPYVMERLLAAEYGVALALKKNSDYKAHHLPVIAKDLYLWFYAKDAPYGTTHILMRDYSLHTIGVALDDAPELLTEAQKSMLKRPFDEGGLRDWGNAEDEFDEHSYDGPIHMDFGIYTVGRISSYEKGEESKPSTVRELLYWRIYNLGYDKIEFKDSERATGEHSRFIKEKVDRLGKKYSWIAYFELAGFYEDKMLLDKHHYDDFRFSEVDIDPTFPNDPNKLNLINCRLTGDDQITTFDWLYNVRSFDNSILLKQTDIAERNGEWILLYGHFNQEDVANKRLFTTTITSLCVKSTNINVFRDLIDRQELHEIVDIPNHTYHVFQGEVPLSDVFPKTTETIVDFFSETVNISKVYNTKEEWDTSRRHIYWKDLNSDELIFPYTHTTEQKQFKDITIQYIVRDVGWESKNGIKQSRHYTVPTKELITVLNLHNEPQDYNYYDENNKEGILYFAQGENFSKQEFLYIRKDLIDEFLKKTNMKLAFLYYGDKRLWDIDNHSSFQDFYEQYGLEARVILEGCHFYENIVR